MNKPYTITLVISVAFLSVGPLLAPLAAASSTASNAAAPITMIAPQNTLIDFGEAGQPTSFTSSAKAINAQQRQINAAYFLLAMVAIASLAVLGFRFFNAKKSRTAITTRGAEIYDMQSVIPNPKGRTRF